MQIEPYILLEEIGNGAHGVVYKGYHKDYPEEVLAIKVISNTGNLDTLFVEPELLSLLHHPNIISLKDYFLDSDRLVLVTEYIDGDNLQSYLNQRGELSESEIKAFLTQIAEALAHAHSRNIVHRDIKPSNILVFTHGEETRFILADFGVSRIAQGIQTVKHIAGTYHYMAPEQFRGRPSEQSDLWALGACAYTLFTGNKPFRGNTKEELFREILYGSPKAISKAKSVKDLKIEEIIFKLLDKDLVNRFSDARSLLNELSNLKGASPDNSTSPNNFIADDKKPVNSSPPTWEQRDVEELKQTWKRLKLTFILGLIPINLILFGIPPVIQLLISIIGAFVFYLGQRDNKDYLTIGGICLLLANTLSIYPLINSYTPDVLKFSLMNLLYSFMNYLTFSKPFEAGNLVLIALSYLIIILLPLFVSWSVLIVIAIFYTKIKQLRDNIFLHKLLEKSATDREKLTQTLKDFVDSNWTNTNIRQKYIEHLLFDQRLEEAIVESTLALKEVDPYNFGLTLLLASSYFEAGLYDICKDTCDQYLAFSNYSFEFQDLKERCQNAN